MPSRVYKELQQQHPESPWLWNPDWRDGTVRTHSKKSMIGAIALATLFNALSWPMTLLVLPGELENGNRLALVMLIFPLAALGIAILAFRAIRRFMKFGESSFRLAANPGLIGGSLSGAIVTSTRLSPTNGFKLRLNCVHRTVSGTGKNRHISETILWQSMQTIKRTIGAAGAEKTAIPVQFSIPYDCEPCSDNQTDSDRVFWKLEITADQPGVDFHTHFEVPVFKTAESSPEYQPDTSRIEDFVDQPSIEAVYREARLDRQSDGRSLKIRFPFLRDIKSALSSTLFLLWWMGFIALFGYGIEPSGVGSIGLIGMIVLAAFGLVGILIGAMVIELWLWRGSIRVDGTGIEIVSSRLMTSTRFVDVNEFKTISLKRTMQAGTLVFNDLVLETKTEGKNVIGRRVVNEVAGRAIIADIESHLFELPAECQETPFVTFDGVSNPINSDSIRT